MQRIFSHFSIAFRSETRLNRKRMSDHTKNNRASRGAVRDISNLTTDDLAFLEKRCLRIMEETSDPSELVKAAEFLSTVRLQQDSSRVEA